MLDQSVYRDLDTYESEVMSHENNFRVTVRLVPPWNLNRNHSPIEYSPHVAVPENSNLKYFVLKNICHDAFHFFGPWHSVVAILQQSNRVRSTFRKWQIFLRKCPAFSKYITSFLK